MFDIKEELKNLPESPGVYLMHDASGKIIYVGKAKLLKNRVRQYFGSGTNHSPKVRAMVANISYFEYIITDTEMEALVLECNLIKKYSPKYNILLKDDKQYPYIKITMNEEYPKIMMSRTADADGAKYFGPYVGMSTVKNTIAVVQKIFMPPVCKRVFPRDIKKGRPCLNYHIKNCFAPCTGEVTQKEFYDVFLSICRFLEGEHKELLAEFTDKMNEASKNLDYERAALFRDRIKAIGDLDEKQKIVDAGNNKDRDIISVSVREDFSFVAVFFIRGGKVIGRENYKIENVQDTEKSDIIADFIKQFYSGGRKIPKEIVSELWFEDIEIVSDMLTELAKKKITITVPKRGEKKDFIDMARKNAEDAAENEKNRYLREGAFKVNKELARILDLDKEPKRIESYDISNISGADSVGAMVVFEDGKAVKRKYRQFKIKTVSGADDYQSTSEVIYRRFRRAKEEAEAIERGKMLPANAKFLPHPDLILADGGKGHVMAISNMLSMLEIDIPVFGMVKDNKHRTRALVGEFGEIDMPPYGTVFNYITNIQDEVHRYAITCFRSIHSKSSFHSELDDIPGVGKKRRLKLMEHFGGIDKIKSASIEELNRAVDKKTAEAVFKFFNGE